MAVSWIAFLKSVEGDRQGATPYYELAVAIYSKILPPDHPDLATSLNNLGFDRAETGRGDEAEALYRRALDIRERVLPPNDPAIADTLNNLAELYKSEERIDEVVPLLNRALEIRTRSLPPDDPRIAASLQNLAGALELDPKGDKFVASQKLLEKALAIRLKSQRPDHPEVAGVISKLATNLFNQNKFREAEARFREALALRRKSQPANHPDIAATLTGLGLDHLELKSYSDAEAEFREALSIRQKVLAPKASSIAQSLGLLARALDREGRATEALETMRRGTAILLDGGEIKLKDKEQLYSHLELVSRDRPTNSAAAHTLLAEAFGLGQHVEQSEAASAVAKMAARFATDDLVLQDLVRERDEIDTKLNSLERKFTDDLSRPPEKRDSNTRTAMDALDQRRLAIDVRLKRDFPQYFNLVRPEPLSVETVSGLLKPDEALISIVSGPDETYVWAVTREGAAWHRVAVSRDWLASSVTSLRPSLDTEDLKNNISNEGSLFDLGLSYDIYAKLLEPLEGTFKDKAHLLIVPSGPLTSLPFQVLVTKRPSILHPKLEQLPAYGDADWLIRHYALSVLPSVSSLKALRQLARPATPLRPLIGFGNPKLNKRISSNATHIEPMRVAEAETRGAASNSARCFRYAGHL